MYSYIYLGLTLTHPRGQFLHQNVALLLVHFHFFGALRLLPHARLKLSDPQTLFQHSPRKKESKYEFSHVHTTTTTFSSGGPKKKNQRLQLGLTAATPSARVPPIRRSSNAALGLA